MKTKVATFAILITAIVGGFAYGATLGSHPVAVQAVVTQDQCQYPIRPLNADGTCDNSDPCNPERIKIDGGKCVDELEEKISDTTIVPEPVKSVEPEPEVSQCGK